MTDDIIGSITGTATYERVAITPGDNRVEVIGIYLGDKTTYAAPHGKVYIGGMELDLIHDEFWLTPEDGDFLWVESTGEELYITEDKP